MSVLAPLINSFLGNQMQENVSPDLVSAASGLIPAAEKAYRNQYNDRGYIHHDHEGYDDHSSQSYVHHYGKKGYTKKKSRSVALSALTLLAFLFFLHILQQCIHDQQTHEYHQTTTAAPQVVIRLKAAREAEKKEAQKRVGDSPEPDTAADRVDKVDKVERVSTTTTETPRRRVVSAFTESSDLYQYGRVSHVPVKMTMVEKYSKL